MSARVRKSAAYSIPVLVLCAIWLWVSPPRMSPAAPAAAAAPARARADQPDQAASADDPQPAMSLGPFPPKLVEMPVAERPTGGPYVDAESIRLSGLEEAIDRGAVDPQAKSVRFMTYGEAVEWYGTGTTPTMDPFREVYVVSVPGRITVGHRVRRSYASSYYIYDASSGRLVQFGATDLADPVATGRPLPR